MKPPEEFRDLLEKPIFAAFATVRQSGAPQAHPMWFLWEDGEDVIKLTHTRTRHNYQFLQHDPRVALLMVDPELPYRYLQVRGKVTSIEDDPEGALYQRLEMRYRGTRSEVADKDVRVAITIAPTAFVTRAMRRR